MPSRQEGLQPAKGAGQAHAGKRRLFPLAATFVVSFATWLILSGKFDPFHLSLGIVACAIVAWTSGDMLFGNNSLRSLPRPWFGFIAYVPWLLYQIFLANLHLLKLTFHPRMMECIDPHILRFRSRLNSHMAMYIFANSITLTPGTITVFVSVRGDFKVHCIDQPSGESLPGEMEARVARIFGD
jgi:multicomponent Na+:H+ antiporter subunit E